MESLIAMVIMGTLTITNLTTGYERELHKLFRTIAACEAETAMILDRHKAEAPPHLHIEASCGDVPDPAKTREA